MWRWLGTAFIAGSLGSAGFLVARTYEQRPAHLRALQTALALLATEITYTATPLPEALAAVGRHVSPAVGRFAVHVAEQLRTDPRPAAADAWRRAVSAQKGRWALTAEDEAVLLDLAPAIGRSFADDQEKHLRLALTRLARRQEEAEAAAKDLVRLWRYGGWCAAALLILLLY